MAKKKEVVIAQMKVDWSPAMSEAIRKERFPNYPPPTLKQLKELKNKPKK